MLKEFKTKLQKYADRERAQISARFFKTEKGGYGEDDVFIGVRVPDIRIVAREFMDINCEKLKELLHSEIHEIRYGAVIILTEQAKRAQKNGDTKKQKHLAKCYLKNIDWVNNWDLVDVSAQYVLGQVVYEGLLKKSMLEKLLQSKNMWHRRIAIIATWTFTRGGDCSLTLEYAERLLADKEDLIHKAVGWMLREVWKSGTQSAQKCEEFLRIRYDNIPRTTLRYAIEKMPEQKRKMFLRGVV